MEWAAPGALSLPGARGVLELLTLVWGSSPPAWSRYVSPTVAAGTGVFYGEAHDRGFGVYAEAEADIPFRIVEGIVLHGGYRGSLYAAGVWRILLPFSRYSVDA